MLDRIVTALRWATLGHAVQRIFSWIVTLIVIRLLSPDDYGLMAISMVLITIAGILNDLGLNAALIQKDRPEPHVAPRIYGAVLLLGGLAFVIVQAVAAPFAAFYDNPHIDSIARILSVLPVLGAVSSVPTALLLRDIEFRAISLLEVARTVFASLLVLFLAWTGWGVWALVYGSIAGGAISAIGILVITRFSLRPSFQVLGISRELRFGGFIMANGLLSAINQNIASLLIGRLLGISSLGLFQVATDVAKMPVRALLRPVARVSFPAVARLQGDLERVSDFYLHMTATLLLVLLPVCWGLAAIAEEFVALVLGTKWEDAAPVITAVSLFVPLRILNRLMQSALDGVGRPEISLRNTLTILLCVVPAIIIGVRWGIVGAAVAWSVSQLLALLINLYRSLPSVEISWGTLLGRIGPGILSAASMFVAVPLIRNLLPDELSLLAVTVLLIGSGVLIYAAATLLVNRKAMLDALRWIQTRSL